jgi:hypothetical protein
MAGKFEKFRHVLGHVATGGPEVVGPGREGSSAADASILAALPNGIVLLEFVGPGKAGVDLIFRILLPQK